MTKLTPCTKEEFAEFLVNYPNELVRDINRICDPPMVTYNDFTTGNVWPESVVAGYMLGDDRGPSEGWRILQSHGPEADQ